MTRTVDLEFYTVASRNLVGRPKVLNLNTVPASDCVVPIGIRIEKERDDLVKI